MIRTAMDKAGRGKILFGTDAPLNNPAVYVGGARFEALDETGRAALFSGNFRRLCASNVTVGRRPRGFQENCE